MNHLTRPEKVGGGDAGPRGADIQRLGEFNELCPGGVDCPQEHGHLETDSGRLAPLGGVQVLSSLRDACFQGTHLLVPAN